MIFVIQNRKKKIEKLRNQTFSWRTQKPRTKRNQNQDEKPKLKSIFFFFVISVSYKKEKGGKKTYPIKDFFFLKKVKFHT